MSTSTGAISKSDAKLVAKRAYRSEVDLGLILRWFGLFTRYRYVLSEQLAADHSRQGFEPRLLCPAMIDYDHWLGEHIEKSTLPEQVQVMGRLSRRTSGPVVHGFVSFDPLRQALHEAGSFVQYDPLALARTAIRDEGFLGVKLYPPMGFKPFDNAKSPCQTYPDIKAIRTLIGTQPDDLRTANCSPRPTDGSVLTGERLDKAMVGLFDLCVAEDAAVLAHTNDSNSASQDASSRADPAYWIPVLRRWPTLRLCLAHFGSFSARSADASSGQNFPEASWEWTLGRYIKANPAATVFADVSFLTEIFQGSAVERTQYISNFRNWIATFDPDCRHLVFGTDWTMLGLDPAYEGYTKRVYAFFKRECGFNGAQLDQLFVGNAASLLGLRRGDKARARLLSFYDKHNVPHSRLPAFG